MPGDLYPLVLPTPSFGPKAGADELFLRLRPELFSSQQVQTSMEPEKPLLPNPQAPGFLTL